MAFYPAFFVWTFEGDGYPVAGLDLDSSVSSYVVFIRTTIY
ncbi:hypothetical protein JOC58_000746 [Paenibacillus hunanensis]|uniref:Uncharacterized protein n=1 Tax=Paenibacillus hunanensis TaxID=539262 RepID=A0ABU1IWU4_9BACL|nr:hypothetical protein [Paenibacillus hunanensis]